MTPTEALASLGLTIRTQFVPFSQSRNKDNKDTYGNPARCLNWKVTLLRNDREVMTTDYSAGIAHTPAYKQNARWTIAYTELIDYEIEKGFAAKSLSWGITKGPAIQPKAEDVVYSLQMDSSVLDHANFESWAGDFGYDTDSRSAETIYRACLEIALTLRAAIGEAGIETLRAAFQDY